MKTTSRNGNGHASGNGQAAHIHLKSLQSQAERARAELKEARDSQAEVNQKVTALQAQLRRIEDEIKQLSEGSEEIVVTEHAYLRYFERVLGYDLNEIRKKLLPQATEEAIKKFGGGSFPVEDDGHKFKVRVKNRVMISVLGEFEE